ncbi:MAG: T9SS type A sorting domain-containing protein [Chitinophagales bacterium]|nr:T9SS type A sorting domain-containing protein [Chitinophagales bacterium]
MKKLLLLPLTLFAASIFTSHAQSFAIKWQNALGGYTEDAAKSATRTNDGGYIVAGFASSNDGDVTGNHGGNDYWIVKLTSNGHINWEKSYGGTGDDNAQSIRQCADGGYIISGYSNTHNNGDVTGYHGDKSSILHDYWIVKIDSLGTLEWEHCFGGTGEEVLYKVYQTSDGGYIAVGSSASSNGDITGNHGNSDGWIVKLDFAGKIQWEKSYGGSESDGTLSIKELDKGGYIFVAYSNSSDGQVTGHHGSTKDPELDYWVVRLDISGNIIWEKSYGGKGIDYPTSVAQIKTGEFVVSGYSTSNDGDVSVNYGGYDYWVIKIDGSGNLLQQVSLGGSGDDLAYCSTATRHGGIVVGGYSFSEDGDVIGLHTSKITNPTDFWIVSLDSSLQLQSQSCLGGGAYEYAYDVEQDKYGGLIVAGSTSSNDGDVTGYHTTTQGLPDYWIVRLKPNDLSIDENLTRRLNQEEDLPAEFTISPTITTGTFQLHLLTTYITSTDQATIQVFNSLGQLVLIKQAVINDGMLNTLITFDVAIPKGIYFIRLKTCNQQYSRKVVYQ